MVKVSIKNSWIGPAYLSDQWTPGPSTHMITPGMPITIRTRTTIIRMGM